MDIAWLERDTSKVEGLGKQSLGNSSGKDVILNVVRCLNAEDAVHVDGEGDPMRDYEII